MVLGLIIPPVVGGIIGYITNDIAIRMLFHPRKTVYIGRFRIPFTPGLIPKEKTRVAKSIGKMISTQLLDSETVEKAVTSDIMIGKFRAGMEELIENNRHNTSTVEEVMLKFAPAEVIDSVTSDVCDDITALVYKKLTEFKFGETISKSVLQKLKDKLGDWTLGIMSTLVNDDLLNSIAHGVGELIDKVVRENSQEIIGKVIDSEIEKVKAYRVCDVIEKYNERFPMIIDFVLSSYKRIIQKNLGQILRNVDIEKIVEEKIDSFNVMELESMIFGIMKKELNAIVYLGALLGFIMGWVNVLLNNMI